LRTVAFGWQQESLAQNAIEVQKAGSTLYKRLSVFGEHLAKAGRHLGGAVESYNKAVGSLERNVLPQAKRFHDLGVGSSERQMPQPEPIDSTPRLFQAPELTGSEFSDDDESCDVVEIESPVRMLPAPSGEALRARSR
jgi:DNA recombination protein RmuC